LVLIGGNVMGGGTALAVDEGKIADVGSDDAIRPWIGPDTKVVGLAGRTVLPGLADAHMHLSGLGARRFGVDLVGTTSLIEVKAKIAEAVKKAPPGTWIRGRGWDQNDWEGFQQPFPSAEDLDSVAPSHPVILARIDGHAIWVSSKAMGVAGVTAKTKDVKGGQIIRKRGKPSGIFVDAAMDLITAKVPPLTAAELEEAIAIAEAECLAAGLTQVHDMGVTKGELELLAKMDAAGRLRLRVYAMHDGSQPDLEAILAGGPLVPEVTSKARLTVRGVKLMVDGALGSRGAALLEPYADDKKNKGKLMLEPDELERRVRLAADKGFQVATHAIGDLGNRVVLDAYAKVFASKAWMKRPRIEHAQVIHMDDIGRFGKGGVIASIQPTHATSDMPWAEQRIGKARIQGAYAWQRLITSSATIAAGSDAPVEDISPVLGLYAAITRKDLFGSPEGGWHADQRMKPEEAVAAFTRGAAWAAFWEKDLGRLEKGYVADLTVLDHDPLTASEEKLAEARAMLTIIGGEIVFAKPGADAPPMEPKTSSTATVAASR
jgi:hypothetical protein